MPTAPIWVLDTSSLIVIRTQTSRDDRRAIYDGMRQLVRIERLMFPREVVGELRRYAGSDNPALEWAIAVAQRATANQPSFTVVRDVLRDVPEVLDPQRRRCYGISTTSWDSNTHEEYWISGIKKNGRDRHWAGSGKISIEAAAVDEYLEVTNAKQLDLSRFSVSTAIKPCDRARFHDLENRPLGPPHGSV